VVQLLDGSTVLTTANVTNGTAQLTYSFPAYGTHSLTAVYSGDANFTGSTSAALSQAVKSPTTAMLSSSPNPSTDGATVTFTVIVQQSGATGTVNFLDGAATLGTATLSNGSATFSAVLAAGSHTITANYLGDSNFQPSSATLTQTVKTNTSTTLAANPTSITAGQTVQFSATVAPAAATGTVQFFDGGTSLGTAALSNGVAVLSVSTLAAGTHNVNSLYSGDNNYASSSSSYAGVVVSKVTTTATLATSLNPSISGQAVTFTATVTPAAASGSVQFLDGATALGTVAVSGGSAAFSTASLVAGSHSITANYSGDGTYNAASAGLTETVKATSAMTLSASSTSISVGQAVQLAAWVTPTAATGSVQFLDGASVLGTVGLSGGTASLSIATLSAGTHNITAAYAGDGNDAGSTSSAVTVTVAKLAASLSIGSSLNPSISGQAVTFTAAVTPAAATGSVQFLDGATVLGTVPVSGGSAAFSTAALAPGNHSITASYSGDGTYSAAVAGLAQLVKAISTVVVISNSPSVISGQTVQFTASVSPASASGSVQFKDGGTVLATVTLSSGIALYSTSTLSVGAHPITAVYGGDTSDTAGTSAVYSQTVTPVPPGAPSNLTAKAQAYNQINLAWHPSPTSGVTYNVYGSTTAGFTPSASTQIATGVNNTNYSVKGLAPSTTYYFLVTAQNANGESAASNQASGTTPSGIACHIDYNITNQNGSTFGTSITLHNTGIALNGWTLTWTFGGNQQITQSWNANYAQNGSAAALTNASWNGSVAAGANVSGIGFNGTYSGSNGKPQAFYLNGTLCN
jgi:hypothetical protein